MFCKIRLHFFLYFFLAYFESIFYQVHALRVPVVPLEPASFENTEVWDIDRVFAQKGLDVLADFDPMF